MGQGVGSATKWNETHKDELSTACCTMEMLAWNVYNSVCVEYRGACPSELPPLRDGILLGVSDLVGDGFLGHETFRWKFSRSLVNVCPHDTDADNE